MPTWNEFVWAAFLFHVWNSNDAYIQLMHEERFTNQLWAGLPNPNNLEIPYIADKIIEFLQDYRCRLASTQTLVDSIQHTLQQVLPHLEALHGFEIPTVNFEQLIEIDGDQNSVGQSIQYLYDQFDAIRGIGPTTAKLLHILQPNLFVMWDDEIANHYHNYNNQINRTPEGYYYFLVKIQQFANIINQEFREALPEQNQTPANYLSHQLNIYPPKLLAKYLDEYNWVTITKGIALPPDWHPDLDFIQRC